jgi:hypothetical protein
VKLQLRSDFRDFYDHMFDRSGDVFERFTRTDMHRRDVFELLSRAGYKVPPHGTAAKIKSVFHAPDDGWTVVAYDDPFAHRGEGKRKTGVNTLDPETYCSLYLGTLSEITATNVSYREVWIGRLWIGMCYRSNDEWRSNVGDVEIVTTGMSEDIPRPDAFVNFPLVAVDLVGSMDDGYAVDLNTAPGLSAVRDMLRAGEVVDHIKEFLETRHEPRL